MRPPESKRSASLQDRRPGAPCWRLSTLAVMSLIVGWRSPGVASHWLHTSERALQQLQCLTHRWRGTRPRQAWETPGKRRLRGQSWTFWMPPAARCSKLSSRSWAGHWNFSVGHSEAAVFLQTWEVDQGKVPVEVDHAQKAPKFFSCCPRLVEPHSSHLLRKRGDAVLIDKMTDELH